MKKKKNLYRILEFVAMVLLTSSIITLGSKNGDSGDNYIFIYITSSISLVLAFIVSITQGLLNKYTKHVFGFAFLIILVTVIEFYLNEHSITPILFNIVASASALTFYGVEKDRKAQEEKASKTEEDEIPYILSKPSDFEINESDFEVEESEIEK